MAITKPASPGCLKTGRIKGSKSTPKNFNTPSSIITSAIIKNGSREGISIKAQVFRPLLAPLKVAWGWIIIANASKRESKAIKV